MDEPAAGGGARLFAPAPELGELGLVGFVARDTRAARPSLVSSGYGVVGAVLGGKVIEDAAGGPLRGVHELGIHPREKLSDFGEAPAVISFNLARAWALRLAATGASGSVPRSWRCARTTLYPLSTHLSTSSISQVHGHPRGRHPPPRAARARDGVRQYRWRAPHHQLHTTHESPTEQWVCA